MTDETTILEIVLTPSRKLFYSDDSSFGIYACDIAEMSDNSDKIELNSFGNFTLKGVMPELKHKGKYVTEVVAKQDKKYGLGYEVISIYEQMPSSKEDQREFLETILTDKQTDAIFNVYPDDDVLKLIEEDKVDISLLHGIGEVTFAKIKNKIEENKKYREAIVKLSKKYGLTPKMIMKMSDSYGSPTLLIQKIEENPYILADDVNKVGFSRADEIALKQGYAEDSPKRIKACILYCLKEESGNGHSWLSKKMLAKFVADNTDLRITDIVSFIEHTDIKGVYKFNHRVALKSNYDSERGVAESILRLLEVESNYHIPQLDDKIDDVELDQGFEFTEEQREAIKLSVEKNVVIINGKAGTGKTSVLKGLLKVLRGMGERLNYGTCALSGKASQRIKESTGLDSSTIHRILGFNPSTGFMFNLENPMDRDIVVLDEASMVNAPLFRNLVSAVKDGAKLIILGDIAQLEPIGVGNVLVDLINSGAVPSVELTVVHRQAQKSGILSKANMVREGKAFARPNDFKNKRLGELKDLFYMPFKDKEDVLKSVIKVSKRYKSSGEDIMDFQVIVPTNKRGELSTMKLNKILQNIFNPDEEGTMTKLQKGKKHIVEFRQGDKVIQNGNNYDKGDEGIFNGTIGMVEYIDSVKKIMVVNFQGVGRIEYKENELMQLDLSYALTIHKTQGSQSKHVLMAIDYSGYSLLCRQLIYTGMTRAVESLFLIAEAKALDYAIKTDKSTKRNTFLVDILNNGLTEPA